MQRPLKYVLFVEDHDPTRSAMTRVLADQGFTVYPRSSAEDAVAREFEHKQLDLAILDVVLPGMQGDALAVYLRRKFPRLPIVFTSARPDLQRLKQLIPDAEILMKPLNVESLLGAFIY